MWRKHRFAVISLIGKIVIAHGVIGDAYGKLDTAPRKSTMRHRRPAMPAVTALLVASCVAMARQRLSMRPLHAQEIIVRKLIPFFSISSSVVMTIKEASCSCRYWFVSFIGSASSVTLFSGQAAGSLQADTVPASAICRRLRRGVDRHLFMRPCVSNCLLRSRHRQRPARH